LIGVPAALCAGRDFASDWCPVNGYGRRYTKWLYSGGNTIGHLDAGVMKKGNHFVVQALGVLPVGQRGFMRTPQLINRRESGFQEPRADVPPPATQGS
jgi:hypothetical protein